MDPDSRPAIDTGGRVHVFHSLPTSAFTPRPTVSRWVRWCLARSLELLKAF